MFQAEQNEESDSEEDSEESEEEEDEDKIEEPTIELKNRLKAAMGEEVDSEAESVDMDDMDDEAIDKLNTMLGQVFKQMSGKKSSEEKRKEKKDIIAQIHFKLRALDMIDSYLSHKPLMSNVIILIVPLIKALENSTKDKHHAPLETRLKGTLKKLTSIKKHDLDSDFSGELLTELFQALVDLGNSGSPVVGQMSHPVPLFAQLASLIVKCNQHLQQDETKKDKKVDKKIKQLFEKALNDFFNESTCLIPISFFQLPLQGSWSGILNLVPKLIENGFSNETRNFRRIQAVTLLSTVLHNPNLKVVELSNFKLKPDDLKILSSKVTELLNTYLTNQINLKPKMVCELLHLIHGLHGLKEIQGFEDIVDWTEMKNCIEKLRAKVPKNRHFQEVKKAFNKVSAPLKIQVVQGSEKKRKQENNDNSTDHIPDDINNGIDNGNLDSKQKKKKKKKKQSKETLQKRKEKKKFDLEDQYKNVELPSFKNSLVDNINLDEAEPPKKKKKKSKVKE